MQYMGVVLVLAAVVLNPLAVYARGVARVTCDRSIDWPKGRVLPWEGRYHPMEAYQKFACRYSTIDPKEYAHAVEVAIRERYSSAYRRLLMRGIVLGDVASITKLLDAGVPADFAWEWSISCCTARIHPLHLAIFMENGDVVRLLLRKGGLVKDGRLQLKTKDLLLPLHFAIIRGSMPMVRLLLQEGADPAQTDEHGENALIIATVYRQRAIAEYLATHGAPIDAANQLGRTALVYAVATRDRKLFEFLLQHGASLKVPSLLHAAVWAGDGKMVRFLLSHGVDPEAKDHKGRSPFVYAVVAGTMEGVIPILQKGVHPSDRLRCRLVVLAAREGRARLFFKLLGNGSEKCFVSLGSAVRGGNMKIIKYVFDHMYKDREHGTFSKAGILHDAVLTGKLPVVSFLLNHGFDINGIFDGETPLMATRFIHDPRKAVSMARFLLSHGADPNKHGTNSDPFLFLLISERRPASLPLLKLILSHKKTLPSIETDMGDTPLCNAIETGNFDAVKLLVAHEASLRCDHETLYMVDKAIQHSKYEIARYLLGRGRRVHLTRGAGSFLVWLLERGDTGTVLRFLAQGGTLFPGGKVVGRVFAKAARMTKRNVLDRLVSHDPRRPAEAWLRIAVWAMLHGDDVLFERVRSRVRWDRVSWNWVLGAIRGGSTKIVKFLVDHGGTLDLKLQKHRTLLHVAARHGSAELVRYLLSKGLDPNARDEKGWTPLHMAARYGDADTVKALIKGGARVDARTSDGVTPLMLAVVALKPAVVKALVAHGANVNARAKNGWNALHFLSKARLPDDVRILFGFSPELMDMTGLLLEMGVNPRARDRKGWEPIHRAVKASMVEIIHVLHRHGEPLEAATLAGFTPLHIAAIEAKRWVIEYLLQAGARVDPRTRIARATPLLMAASKGYGKTMNTLMEHGASLDATDFRGWGVVHLLAARGEAYVLGHLLASHSLNVNTPDVMGWTPAILGAGSLEVLRILAKHGADLRARTRNGVTAYHIAALRGSVEGLRFLESAGVRPSVTDWGATPLHMAAANSDPTVLRYLLSKGLDINARDILGFTPIMVAASHGRLENVKILLRVNARTDDVTVTGKRLLDLATPDVRRWLRKHGVALKKGGE